MKSLLISLATAGFILSTAVAIAQNQGGASQSGSQQGGAAVAPGSTQSQSAPSGERRGGTTSQSSQTQSNERREGDTGGRRGARSGGSRDSSVSGRRGSERSGVNLRIRTGGDGYRYRSRHRVGVYVGGCRTIIVKKRYHGRTVVKRIRRCG